MEYKKHEASSRREGQDWVTSDRHPQVNIIIDGLLDEHGDVITCLHETKALHNIPKSYHHTMATNPEGWMIPMKVEMEMLKAKHTWDLVKPLPGANIMDLMWVYDIK